MFFVIDIFTQEHNGESLQGINGKNNNDILTVTERSEYVQLIFVALHTKIRTHTYIVNT